LKKVYVIVDVPGIIEQFQTKSPLCKQKGLFNSCKEKNS